MALQNPPDPQQPVVRPSDGRVDQDWYQWFLAFVHFVNLLVAQLSDLEGTVGAIGDTVIADQWCDFIVEVENGDIVVVQKATFAGTITGCVTDADSGTCTVRPKIDGTNVGSSNNSVSTTESDVTHSTSNTFTAGQTISYTISSNSACLGARVQINYTRALVD